MFFIGVFGTDSKVKPLAGLNPLACPVCHRTVSLSLCHSYHYFHAFFIPLFHYSGHYFATCPDCASVFELSEESGRKIAREGVYDIGPSELTLVRNNLRYRCPGCGAVIAEGSSFCANCGLKL